MDTSTKEAETAAKELFAQGFRVTMDVKYSLTGYELTTPSDDKIEFTHCWDREAHRNHPEFSSDNDTCDLPFTPTPELLDEIAYLSR